MTASVKEQKSLRIFWASEILQIRQTSTGIESYPNPLFWLLREHDLESVRFPSWTILSNIVDNNLSCGYHSIRSQIISRYVKFFQTLLSFPSKEVAVIARVAGGDAGSNTGRNIKNIRLETKLNPVTCPVYKIKEFLFRPAQVPENDVWRLPLLFQYVNTRNDQVNDWSSTEYMDNLIDCLCTS